MAILSKIRQRSIFLIAIIALALFAFVLTDVIKNGGLSTGKSQRIVGTVNGDDLSQQDFAEKVDQTRDRYGRGFTTTQAVNQVWEQEVRRIVLDGQYDELGITIEGDRVGAIMQDALRDNPTFQDENGVYSQAKLNEYLATIRSNPDQSMYNSWVEYENTLAKNEKQNIYFNLIKAGLNTTFKEGEMAYGFENNTRDIEFVQVAYTSINDDDVSVTKEDIKNYINTHKEDYKTDAKRSLRFVKFEERPTQADELAVRKEVEALLNERVDSRYNDTLPSFAEAKDLPAFVAENSDINYVDRYFFKTELPAATRDSIFKMNEGDVYGPYKDNGYWKISKMESVKQLPDSVQASHILLVYAGLQNAGDETRSKADTKALADSLASVIRKDKSKMATLAPEYSADGVSREKGGDLGYATKNTFASTPAFSNYIFEGKTGDVGVVESPYGFHVIKIDDQKNPQRAVKVATVAKVIEPSQSTVDETFTKATKFEMAVTKDKENFATIAKDSIYNVRPVNNIGEMDETLPGQGPQRELIRWAFDEDSKVGDIKRFTVDRGFLVVQLTEKIEKGTMSVDEASASVTPLVRKEKKAKMIMDKISGSDLSKIASDYNTSVQTASALNLMNPTIAGAGREPKVMGKVFGLEEGQVSKPIEGDKGVYVVKVNKITPAQKMENYASFSLQKTNADRAAVNTQVVTALKEVAEIEDNRATFY